MFDDISIFIRASGERTEEACLAAITTQGISPDQVEFIREAPFARALSEGYSRAVQRGRAWAFFIDADIILRPGSLKALEQFALRESSDTFCFQGYFLDKFTLSLRDGGVHAYQTRHLDKALELVDQSYKKIRPESFVKLEMQKLGWRWRKFNYVIGIHDFEQYNFDIFRKGFVHAQKHLHLLPDLIPKFSRKALTDPDYVIMLEGVAEGIRSGSQAQIDINFKPFRERFDYLLIEEKAKMPLETLMPDTIEGILASWAADPDLTIRGMPFSGAEAVALDGTKSLTKVERWRALWRRKRNSRSVSGVIIHAMGKILEQFGLWLTKRSGELG